MNVEWTFPDRVFPDDPTLTINVHAYRFRHNCELGELFKEAQFVEILRAALPNLSGDSHALAEMLLMRIEQFRQSRNLYPPSPFNEER